MGYEEIFTYKNLLKAHTKTRKGKLHKEEVISFELNKAEELYKLYEELKKRTYHISPYRTFYIYEPKKRRVDATTYRDRIVQRCYIDNYLSPLLERHLIYDNAACRKDKGTDFARNRLRKFLLDEYKHHGHSFYAFSFDIHHYFESIDHEVLKKKMKRVVDTDIYPFITMIIDSFGGDKGLPLGNQTSQWFALFYLDAFDRIIKERFGFKHYVRYMDDGIILSSDKEALLKLKESLENELEGLKLSFNPKKCAIYPIKQGVSFLGFTYRLSKSGALISKMERKKKRRLVHYLKGYSLKKESLLCYLNYLKKRSSEHLLMGKIRKLYKKALS